MTSPDKKYQRDGQDAENNCDLKSHERAESDIFLDIVWGQATYTLHFYTTGEKMYRARLNARSTRHKLRGIDYHVTEWGNTDNPLLVFLHGLGDAGSTFQFVVDELKHDWFVIAPDWRGFGETRLEAKSYWFPGLSRRSGRAPGDLQSRWPGTARGT